jgi:hypothetical protein
VTGLLHDVARAALPVASALLVVALAARVALWADLDDERLTYVARQYLAPLTTWCLGAVAVYAVALGGAGEAGVVPLALAGGIGAAAVVLRVKDELNRPEETGRGKEPRPVAADARRGRATSAPAGRPAGSRAAEDSARAETRPLGDDLAAARAAGGLWLEPAEDAKRTGLWSR